MPMVRCQVWPAVLPGDESPGAGCISCWQPVGNYHTVNCESVKKRVHYEVLVRGKVAGAYQPFVSHGWTDDNCATQYARRQLVSGVQMRELIANIVWFSSDDFHAVLERCLAEPEAILCRDFDLSFVRTIDYGPFIERKRDQQWQ